MKTFHTIFKSKLDEINVKLNKRLLDEQEANPHKHQTVIIEEIIKKLSFHNKYTLLSFREPQDPNVKAFNIKLNPSKQIFLDIYKRYIDNYTINAIDNLVKEHLKGAIHQEKIRFGNDENYCSWDKIFFKNLSIETALDFIAEYTATEKFISSLYEMKRKDSLSTINEINEDELIFQPIKLKNKEHLTDLNSNQQMALWTLLFEQGLFIKDKNRLSIKKLSLLFNQLTGYSASQFQGKRLKAVERLSQLEKNKIIRFLEEIIITLKNA